MAIKIQGTTVVTDSRDLVNINSIENTISKPVNESPVDGTIDISDDITLSISQYSDLFDNQKGVQFQVSTTSDFSSGIIVDETINNAVNSYTVSVDSLSENQLYYWRARYFDTSNVFSQYSDATTFETGQFAYKGAAVFFDNFPTGYSIGDSYRHAVEEITDTNNEKKIIFVGRGANTLQIFMFDTEMNYLDGLDIDAASGEYNPSSITDLKDGTSGHFFVSTDRLIIKCEATSNSLSYIQAYGDDSSDAIILDIQADLTGTILLVSGYYTSNLDGEPAGYIAAYDTNLNLIKTLEINNGTLSGNTIYDARDIGVLSDGSVLLVGHDGDTLYFVIKFADANLSSTVSQDGYDEFINESSNQFVVPTSDGNAIIGADDLVLKVDADTDPGNVIVGRNIDSKPDKAYEDANNNFVVSNYSTSVKLGYFDGTDFSPIREIELDYSSTMEIFDSFLSEDGTVLYAGGRWYDGADYYPFCFAVPSDLNVNLNTPFVNKTDVQWVSTSFGLSSYSVPSQTTTSLGWVRTDGKTVPFNTTTVSSVSQLTEGTDLSLSKSEF